MIKQIDENSLSDCLNVIHKSFGTVAEEFGLTLENCATNGAFMPLSRLQTDFAKGHLMYALFEGEQIIGFMQLSKKSHDTYELEKLAVLPQNRHNGHGRNLLAFAKSKIIELGARKITIGIIEENVQLKEWYQINGFAHTGTKTFPHLPFTVGFMECTL